MHGRMSFEFQASDILCRFYFFSKKLELSPLSSGLKIWGQTGKQHLLLLIQKHRKSACCLFFRTVSPERWVNNFSSVVDTRRVCFWFPGFNCVAVHWLFLLPRSRHKYFHWIAITLFLMFLLLGSTLRALWSPAMPPSPFVSSGFPLRVVRRLRQATSGLFMFWIGDIPGSKQQCWKHQIKSV